MNKYPSLIEPAHRGTEMAQGFGSAHFSLTIRGDDGEKARLKHMTNYQVMAELVQDPRSDLSDSTTQEIIRLAQLDAIAFAKRHREGFDGGGI
jgi:hypothetical protein